MSTVVFTNGCFDVLHLGHIDLLTAAKALGGKLIVGINSDSSARSIKGSGRPINSAEARRAVLLALEAVDGVEIFEELTPERLIHEIRPDVLVKGGDWARGEIIGASYVESYGGQVVSLPLTDGYSTSDVVRQLALTEPVHASSDGPVSSAFAEHEKVLRATADTLAGSIEDCGKLLAATFAAGKKVMVCGNGGSAADAQHIAAEFVGRYEKERRALPSIALTTDTSALTAIANDYDFERIFARQVDALANAGDCLIAISTSGNSPNVIAAVMKAREKGCKVIGMTGAAGKKLAGLCDACVTVPSSRTARIQEAHITVAHILCEMIDAEVTPA